MPVGNTGKTGDGLRMAWEVGAAEEGVGTIEMFRVAPVGAEFAMGCNLEQAAAQPDLWVTARGERFCDETIGFYDTPVGNAQARYKADGYTFSIFDDSIIERLAEQGLDKGVGVDFPPGYKLTGVCAKRSRPLSTTAARTCSWPIRSRSWPGRSTPTRRCCRATVDEYNRYCAQGHDELFAKDRRYLRPLVGPRYYAVRGRTVFLGTMGGIKVNEKLEVVDKKDNVIPGLYAGGFDAGGMYGDSYPIKSSSGLASAFALNSGRIAGKSALTYLGALTKTPVGVQ